VYDEEAKNTKMTFRVAEARRTTKKQKISKPDEKAENQQTRRNRGGKPLFLVCMRMAPHFAALHGF
jgi:hypothetical protein